MSKKLEVKKDKESQVEESASKEEVGSLAGEVATTVARMDSLEGKLDKVIGFLEKKAGAAPSKEPEPAPAEPDAFPVPPSYRQAVDDILGKDFGCRIVYGEDGTGFMVSIIVPLEKSNAPKSYLDEHKIDIRSKSLAGGEGLAGVKTWCTLVRKNLEKSGVRFPLSM